GRAWSSGLVLDDRYVSPRHALVRRREDGTVVIEDLESVNGLFGEASSERVASLPLTADTRFRVGRTWLRFRAADEPVEAAVPDTRGHEKLALARFPWWRSGAAVGLFAAILLADSA